MGFLQEARRRFDAAVTRVHEGLAAGKLGAVASDTAHWELSQRLSAALIDGQPVAFDDMPALASYTLKRLKTRCSALFNALAVEECQHALKLLLSLAEASNKIHVTSFGGGPA